MVDAPDPYSLPPRLWFGLLCEGVAVDQAGRLNFQAVFNQIALFDPPVDTGMPTHAFFNGVLAVGFTEGLGHFKVEIELQSVDERVLWRRPEGLWEFDQGPGDPTAILVEQVRHWLADAGRYHFRVRLLPGDQEYAIPFEVGRQIGPASVVQGNPPDTPR